MLNCRRVFSGFLAVLLFLTNCVLAHSQETNVHSERRRLQLAALPAPPINFPLGSVIPAKAGIQSVNSISSLESRLRHSGMTAGLPAHFQDLVNAIPEAYATIQSVHNSGDSLAPVVALIQDVHMNPEAQGNIASVLQALFQKNQVGAVGVEGSFGALDFSPFRSFPDKNVAQQVAEAFLAKNLLAAPSYAGITSPVEPPLMLGVDDKKHYAQNVRAYLDSLSLKGRVEKELSADRERLAEAKKKVFSPELLRLDGLREAHHEGALPFGAYVKELTVMASEAKPAMTDLVIDQFLEALEMEGSLDFERVERERRTVIERLTPRLNEEESSALVAQSLAYRLGNLSFGAYYQNVRDLCRRKGIDLRQTPAFDN